MLNTATALLILLQSNFCKTKHHYQLSVSHFTPELLSKLCYEKNIALFIPVIKGRD